MDTKDGRNLINRYWGWTEDIIREDIQKNVFPYSVLVENWQGDFNLSTCIRNANAFGAKEIFYLGKRHWDRRGSLGTHHYSIVKHLKDYDDLMKLKEHYVFIGVDNIAGSIQYNDFLWPKNTLMIFGEEGTGLTSQIQKECQSIVHIKQVGSVRSINAGCASAVMMCDYMNKFESGKL